MTNKPFEVQDDAIVLNGVELQITQEGNITIDNNPVSGGGDLGNLEIDESTILTDIDQDITIQTSFRPTLTGLAGPGTSSSIIVIDISENDDVVVMAGAGGWEVNLNVGGEVPYWKEFTAASRNVQNNTFVISFTGFSGDDYNYPPFAQGTTYTFRKVQEDISQWTFKANGDLETPGSGGQVYVAKRWDLGTSTDHFPGDVGQAIIYAGAMTSSEVTKRWNATRSTYGL